jgi:hypothetical protein
VDIIEYNIEHKNLYCIKCYRFQDSQLYAQTRSRYVENWQRARTEQLIQSINDKESVPTDSIEYYKQRSEHEQRVHAEVEMLINIAINVNR